MPSLLARTGPLTGQRFHVDHEFTVGRVDGDLVIADPKMSGRHASFCALTGGGLEVRDLGSTNGTFVDEIQVGVPTALVDGARVRLASTEFIVVLDRVDNTVVDRGLPSAAHTVVASDAAAHADPGPRPTAPALPIDGEIVVPEKPSRRELEPAPAAAPRFGAFTPPASRRGGLATRSWVPVALSYGSVLLAALALVIYFAAR